MVLVDTSVWVDHFRKDDPRLRSLLEQEEVLTHPLVIGELACGNLRQRKEILFLLNGFPRAKEALHEEVLRLVEKEHLYGKGIGWIDAHLLASTLLSQSGLWTKDKKLRQKAEDLGIAAG